VQLELYEARNAVQIARWPGADRYAPETFQKAVLSGLHLKNENDARTAASQAEADRLKRDSDAQMAAAQNEADRLKRENDAQRASAQADVDRAAKEKAQAEVEKADLGSQLLTQFNAVLKTRDTARAA